MWEKATSVARNICFCQLGEPWDDSCNWHSRSQVPFDIRQRKEATRPRKFPSICMYSIVLDKKSRPSLQTCTKKTVLILQDIVMYFFLLQKSLSLKSQKMKDICKSDFMKACRRPSRQCTFYKKNHRIRKKTNILDGDNVLQCSSLIHIMIRNVHRNTFCGSTTQ